MSWQQTCDPRWSVNFDDMIAVNNESTLTYEVSWSEQRLCIMLTPIPVKRKGELYPPGYVMSMYLDEGHPVSLQYQAELNKEIVGSADNI